jgi:hypothetical protein
MMEQRGRGVKRWANFLLVMRKANIPERETAVPSARCPPMRLESGIQNLFRFPRHFHRLERKEETCDAAKQ